MTTNRRTRRPVRRTPTRPSYYRTLLGPELYIADRAAREMMAQSRVPEWAARESAALVLVANRQGVYSLALTNRLMEEKGISLLQAQRTIDAVASARRGYEHDRQLWGAS